MATTDERPRSGSWFTVLVRPIRGIGLLVLAFGLLMFGRSPGSKLSAVVS